MDIANAFTSHGAESTVVMTAPAWSENLKSEYLSLANDTFNDVLGWRQSMVAMHFVLEAGYSVRTYPGIQIASIGPRILEPHSANERVELSTVDDIWCMLKKLLKRLA